MSGRGSLFRLVGCGATETSNPDACMVPKAPRRGCRAGMRGFSLRSAVVCRTLTDHEIQNLTLMGFPPA
jgi:hypothetical protein